MHVQTIFIKIPSTDEYTVTKEWRTAQQVRTQNVTSTKIEVKYGGMAKTCIDSRYSYRPVLIGQTFDLVAVVSFIIRL